VLSQVWRICEDLNAATIRTAFAQPDPKAAKEQWRNMADGFRARYNRRAELMDDAEDDVLSYLAFPRERWHQIWSNNPLEMASSQGAIAGRGFPPGRACRQGTPNATRGRPASALVSRARQLAEGRAGVAEGALGPASAAVRLDQGARDGEVETSSGVALIAFGCPDC
jgi:hypothetical protein